MPHMCDKCRETRVGASFQVHEGHDAVSPLSPEAQIRMAATRFLQQHSSEPREADTQTPLGVATKAREERELFERARVEGWSDLTVAQEYEKHKRKWATTGVQNLNITEGEP